MDIVSRIKFFMDSADVTSSQFADTCKIPRPTISQILNGRNKKISDEIIGKIHSAYPSLSMLWLMFGEGDMTIKSNIEISGSQNQPTIDFENSEKTDNEITIPTLRFEEDDTKNSQKNFPESQILENSLMNKNLSFVREDQPDKANTTNENLKDTNSMKKIVNIMVFYNDNSFESFTPASVQK